jgi:hypothetical protein
LRGEGVASQLLVIGYLGGLGERGREIKNQTSKIKTTNQKAKREDIR